MSDTDSVEIEADQHPYFRPRDAATLMLIDRSGAIPKVLVGRRNANVVFMPGKFVFPGGRVDKTDYRIPVAAPIPSELEAKLLQGRPAISPARARALAVAAIREACEETGLCLGRKADGAAALAGPWAPFAEAGLLPDPSGLFLIARAITPPGRVRRFDTRFFTADASAIAHRVEGVIHPEAELVELVWVEIGATPLAGLHQMTKQVLGELQRRLAAGPLRHDAAVPFFHHSRGRMQMDRLG
ncbi:8-oxo-dGTP pyrophosphatase MutT (NUDIX family) [Rhodopseudomonas rhenobacensis]|uniref:8-oxo-dGTP pyrophosphatase MutT (NUDIX family) n=1 Tax=Rhodopseudomonas rhenobacensis TaxID=87461 RepID=A0A7W7Z242_9BRAD|nr:NUDIX hydrolase [Rhodopseudomonas rhenobacensis]MBB5046531.1 8-oxo-dGTP pyrophosphatase MutT (NUDIX family) [Rhodopseudomonas rhenobacensis]